MADTTLVDNALVGFIMGLAPVIVGLEDLPQKSERVSDSSRPLMDTLSTLSLTWRKMAWLSGAMSL